MRPTFAELIRDVADLAAEALLQAGPGEPDDGPMTEAEALALLDLPEDAGAGSWFEDEPWSLDDVLRREG